MGSGDGKRAVNASRNQGLHTGKEKVPKRGPSCPHTVSSAKMDEMIGRGPMQLEWNRWSLSIWHSSLAVHVCSLPPPGGRPASSPIPPLQRLNHSR